MKKKGLKLLALAGALFLIVLLGWTANGLIGNPISRYLADKNARKYLEKHFPNTDYYIEDTSYSFKEGAYIADVKAPGSMDRYFSITMDMAGRYRWDSYENVEDGFHTFLRLDEEYRKLTDSVLESPSFPWHGDIMYGTLEIYAKEDRLSEEEDEHGADKDDDFPDYALAQEELEPDKLYDIRQLGAQAGHLMIYIEGDTITAEKAAEAILGVKHSMDDAGVPFYAMEFHLREPLSENGTREEKSIDVLEILYQDMEEGSILQQVRQADKAAKERYAREEKEDEEAYGALE
ncbi:MAG: hypothetical protein HFH40_01415 [Lachnospiraceae bacterium]|jgi:hypothetical protein|nr:hypothetical protein [Lachnospiraceae bacterium]